MEDRNLPVVRMLRVPLNGTADRRHHRGPRHSVCPYVIACVSLKIRTFLTASAFMPLNTQVQCLPAVTICLLTGTELIAKPIQGSPSE
ncbi:hypothetical protein GE107_08450 [Cohnella sp. CFH 77786]|uniref:hypothetical protein n=1 Tax=Cohnella sp. CFH 77786 TaxID=2662265 RepID=UPI001C60CF0C|nr:hypothetical protein [Cohnella sp. CFH 77786]MBW5446090.1 hypothetical protein [Cohnella sp. CFH 77786]